MVKPQPKVGFDCGFDIFPRLDLTPANIDLYKLFLADVQILRHGPTYQRTQRRQFTVHNILTNSNPHTKSSTTPPHPLPDPTKEPFIEFLLGEGLRIPSNPQRCNTFMRFGTRGGGDVLLYAERYVRVVAELAIKYFGAWRIRFWHGLEGHGSVDERSSGFYTWEHVDAVNEAVKKLDMAKK